MPLKIITSVLVLTVVASAVAVPMRFENPARGEEGFFDWENDGVPAARGGGVEIVTGGLLNITLPAEEQMGVNGLPPNATPNDLSPFFGITIINTFDPFQDPPGFRSGQFASNVGAQIATFPLTYPVGQLVGPGGVIPSGPGGAGNIYAQGYNQLGVVGGGSDLSLGEHFLAVSFSEFDDDLNIIGVRYGYLGFELFADEFGFLHVSATRWGYETEFDTAITIIPAPGAGIFLVGGIGVLARRRRSLTP